MKLHLSATVPSEGARRVARWIMTLPGGLADAAVALDMPADRVQRMVLGEYVPGTLIGRRLDRHIGLTWRDFSRPATGWWFARPAPAAVMKASQITGGVTPFPAGAGEVGRRTPTGRPASPGKRRRRS
jgi:hypothetical protein